MQHRVRSSVILSVTQTPHSLVLCFPAATTEPCTRAEFITSAPQLLPKHHFWRICERTEAAGKVLPKQPSCSTFIKSYLFWISFCSGSQVSKTSVFFVKWIPLPYNNSMWVFPFEFKNISETPRLIFNCQGSFFPVVEEKKSKNKHGRSPWNSTE